MAGSHICRLGGGLAPCWCRRGEDHDQSQFDVPLGSQVSTPTERDRVVEWLAAERSYQEHKYPDRTVHDDKMREQGVDDRGFWWSEVNRYLYRAERLGLDTPLGRQAAAKAVATAQEMLASVIRVYGPLPPPGVTSGDVGGAGT